MPLGKNPADAEASVSGAFLIFGAEIGDSFWNLNLSFKKRMVVSVGCFAQILKWEMVGKKKTPHINLKVIGLEFQVF